jgi:hypothetical protein
MKDRHHARSTTFALLIGTAFTGGAMTMGAFDIT